jgi:hypothetical protein
MYRRAFVTIAVVLLLPWTLGSGSADAASGDSARTAATAAAAAAAAAPAAAAGQQQPVDDELVTGRWDGTAEGSLTRTTTFGNGYEVSGGYRMEGELWFSVGAGGHIDDGWAVITYEPFFDVSGFNQALEDVRSIGDSSLLPFPIPMGLATSDLLSVRAEFAEPMSTRQGEITGRLTGDSLSLRWAGGEELELAMTAYIDGVGTSQEVARESLVTEPPWLESAEVSEEGGVVQAESVVEDTSQDGGVLQSISSSWTVGPASPAVPGGPSVPPPAPPPPAVPPPGNPPRVRFDLPSPSESRDQLDSLTVQPEETRIPYDRAEFPHWTSSEGCNTRQVVLRSTATASPSRPAAAATRRRAPGSATTTAST